MSTTNATKLVVISVLIGLAIAGVAIAMEEAGIWHMKQSLMFFPMALLVVGLPWHCFVWRRVKLKPKYDA